MLRLRAYKQMDAAYIVDWLKDETVFYLWSAGRVGTYPITVERLEDYYKGFEKTSAVWQMTAVDEQDIPRGHLIMRYVDDDRTALRLGHIIVDPAVRGKGYGRELLSLAQDYAKFCARAGKVTLGVFANNPAARRCYDAAGLVPTDTASDWVSMPLSGGAQEWECIYLEKQL